MEDTMNEQQDFEIIANAWAEEDDGFSPAGNAIGVFGILLILSATVCCLLGGGV
jgi:hypothetical protein